MGERLDGAPPPQDRSYAMTSSFMAIVGVALILAAIGLRRLKVEPIKTRPSGTNVFSSRPSDFALTPKTAAALMTAVGSALLVTSMLGQ
jgi:hypothetical protein